MALPDPPPALSVDPEVVATPLAALEAPSVPWPAHFRRNHARYPELPAAGFRLRVHGAVARPLALDLAALRALPQADVHATLECAGHRRTEFDPLPSGIAWELGAVAHARWRGPRLVDVLAQAAPDAAAREVVLRGADASRVEGFAGLHRYDRALPLDAPALADAILALELEGAPLPREHGAPLRAVVPGWYAMASVKWLEELELVRAPYAGPWQTSDYRLWRDDLPPAGVTLGALPVSSLLTTPAAGRLAPGPTAVRGIAWGGEGGIASVAVEADGVPLDVRLEPQPGPYAPARFAAVWEATPGAHALTARATDGAGASQPDAVPWNRRGYGNNARMRLQVDVG